MPKRSLVLTVGRYHVTGEYEAVPVDDDGTLGLPGLEWGRLELRAAIAVLSQAPSLEGDELRFARKAMGLRQPDLAALLDVATETVSRWETGADPIRRQTQIAVLLLVEHTARHGQPTLATDMAAPVQIIAAA